MTTDTKGVLHSTGLLILRLGSAGLLLGGHGWSKLMHFSERTADFPNPIGVGATASLALVVFAEVICSLLVIVGLATRLASAPVVIFFLVAGFIQHAPDPWQKKELAFVYMIFFLALLFTGAGRFSLDAAIARRKLRAGR